MKNDEKLNLLGIQVDNQKESDLNNTVEPNNSRLLMSDTLKGNMPEVEGTELEEMASNFVMTIICRNHNDDKSSTTTVGTLRSIMNDKDTIELEINTQLNDAFTFINPDTQNYTINSIELHSGIDNPIKFNNDLGYNVTGCRLLDIDYRRAMCTLLLQMKRNGVSYTNGDIS